MDMIQFLSIGVVGAIISVAVNAIKKKYGTSSNITKLGVILSSIVAAIILKMVAQYGYWESFIEILSAATLLWAFALKKKTT